MEPKRRGCRGLAACNKVTRTRIGKCNRQSILIQTQCCNFPVDADEEGKLMIHAKILAAGMLGCALAVGGASASGSSPQGAFDGIDSRLQSGQPNSAAEDVSLASLKEKVDALAATIALLRGDNVGSSTEKTKLAELAHVVAQLRENVAAASTDPGEIAFLNDEFESLQAQFGQVGLAVLKRETNSFATSVKALQDEGRSGPEAELAKLAEIATATALLKQDVANAAGQNDAARVAPLYAELSRLKGLFNGLADRLTPNFARYVNTLRGAGSAAYIADGYSKGNTFPATAMPFGFNMWSPVNRSQTRANGGFSNTKPWDGYMGNDFFYTFFEDRAGTKPLDTIQAFAVVHEPSPWMGNRQALQIMPVSKTDQAGIPLWDKFQRAEKFKHENEVAKAHYYGVTFDNGVRSELTPTDHAAYFRFTVPAAQQKLAVLFDTFAEVKGTLTIDQAGRSVSGYTDHGSPRMFFHAEFDQPIVQSAKVTPSNSLYDGNFLSWLRFDTTSSKTVGVRIATSFISIDQAKANLAQEIGTKTFDDVKRLAQAAWDGKLNQVKVEGATEDQKIILYSNMYRAFLFPNSAWENVAGQPKYMSSYTSPQQQKNGKIWVNNGFWDTYRTTWPLYTLLFPQQAGEMIDGFVNAYKDGGWTPRWSSPGYQDMMVATSSDIIFADAYLKGVRNFDIDAAYASMLRNATAYSSDSGKGRKGMNRTPFFGYSLQGEEAVSWSLEAYLNDFGVSEMAKALGKTDDAAYLASSAIGYANIFDATSTGAWAGGWFRAKTSTGAWSSPANPDIWYGPYTEGNAWHYTFLAPQDGQGLANLYGGRDRLKAKLDAFFTDEPLQDGGFFISKPEIVSAWDIYKLANVGQYQHSNQPVHHSIYMYNYAGYPAGGQKYLRDVMDKLYFSGFDANGKSTGEGYLGDEDNGEQSAWYVLSAMGFYPVSMGRPEYAIGAPYFPKMTVTMKDAAGNPHELVINAPGVSATNRYVQSVKLNDVPITRSYLRHEELANGGKLDFEMGPAPSQWGTGANDVPSSITVGTAAPTPLASVLPRGGYQVTSSNTNATQTSALSNRDSGGTVWSQPAGSSAWIQATKTSTASLDSVKMYTLTTPAIGGQDPVSWTLKGSNDGTSWTTLDERQNQAFPWRQQVKPFALGTPASYAQYRLEFAGSAAVSIAEFELLAQ